ncbi:hypothetical protein, partial [Achromobacter xylosoxidans]|uniref:hypothetical protein n=1 Tax=Alcaligenes xylosoxydans xylosoxydans TaxID=85698 RepID=UPI001F13B97E
MSRFLSHVLLSTFFCLTFFCLTFFCLTFSVSLPVSLRAAMPASPASSPAPLTPAARRYAMLAVSL